MCGSAIRKQYNLRKIGIPSQSAAAHTGLAAIIPQPKPVVEPVVDLRSERAYLSPSRLTTGVLAGIANVEEKKSLMTEKAGLEKVRHILPAACA
jgi:hypothetical protein